LHINAEVDIHPEINFWLHEAQGLDEYEKFIYFYHKDHLGSSAQISDIDANIVHHIEYMPYGENFFEKRSHWSTRYKFNAKEKDEETGLYYYGARYYTPEISVWLSVDPLSDKYPHQSTYTYCSNNPLNKIDYSGLSDDWVESASGKIYWDKNATSKATTKTGEKYLGKAVVVFNGSKNEKMGTYTGYTHGDYGKNVSLSGKGEVLSQVTVYDSDKNISHFEGYTMSSDPSKFGVLAEGEFTVNRLGANDRKGPYGSEWVVESRSTRLPAKNSFNPAFPNRKPGYLTNVFVHRPNKDGWVGTFQKNGKTHGVSEGCLLIAPNDWNNYEKALKNVNSYHLILNR